MIEKVYDTVILQENLVGMNIMWKQGMGRPEKMSRGSWMMKEEGLTVNDELVCLVVRDKKGSVGLMDVEVGVSDDGQELGFNLVGLVGFRAITFSKNGSLWEVNSCNGVETRDSNFKLGVDRRSGLMGVLLVRRNEGEVIIENALVDLSEIEEPIKMTRPEETGLAEFIREKPMEAWNAFLGRVFKVMKKEECLDPLSYITECATKQGVINLKIDGWGAGLHLSRMIDVRMRYLAINGGVVNLEAVNDPELGRILSDEAEAQRLREWLFKNMGVELPIEPEPVVERRMETISEMPQARPMTMTDEIVQLKRQTQTESKWYKKGLEELQRQGGNKGKKTKRVGRYLRNVASQAEETEARKRRR